ncbi:MAG: hypothetical protein FWC64_01500 [Treponema sp.]|nr:hypothetical protein [Treponema sp.]
MKRRFASHVFWGAHSPLSTLSGAALVIMASSRLSFALICAAALLWVFGLTSLVFSSAKALLPVRGKQVVLLFLSAFFCGIFILLAGIFSPLLILGTGFFLVLVPPYCLGSGFFENSFPVPPPEVFSRALLEAAALSGVIIAAALIREPLGMGTLSFPAGVHGSVEIFDINRDGGFAPIRFLSASAGGLVLLGYAAALFDHVRRRGGNAPREEEEGL